MCEVRHAHRLPGRTIVIGDVIRDVAIELVVIVVDVVNNIVVERAIVVVLNVVGGVVERTTVVDVVRVIDRVVAIVGDVGVAIDHRRRARHIGLVVVDHCRVMPSTTLASTVVATTATTSPVHSP